MEDGSFVNLLYHFWVVTTTAWTEIKWKQYFPNFIYPFRERLIRLVVLYRRKSAKTMYMWLVHRVTITPRHNRLPKVSCLCLVETQVTIFMIRILFLDCNWFLVVFYYKVQALFPSIKCCRLSNVYHEMYELNHNTWYTQIRERKQMVFTVCKIVCCEINRSLVPSTIIMNEASNNKQSQQSPTNVHTFEAMKARWYCDLMVCICFWI